MNVYFTNGNKNLRDFAESQIDQMEKTATDYTIPEEERAVMLTLRLKAFFHTLCFPEDINPFDLGTLSDLLDLSKEYAESIPDYYKRDEYKATITSLQCILSAAIHFSPFFNAYFREYLDYVYRNLTNRYNSYDPAHVFQGTICLIRDLASLNKAHMAVEPLCGWVNRYFAFSRRVDRYTKQTVWVNFINVLKVLKNAINEQTEGGDEKEKYLEQINYTIQLVRQHNTDN